VQQLSDDVLVELGRLAWAAMNLEDATGLVCWSLRGADDNNVAPISQRVTDALKVLRDRLQPEARDHVIAWLEDARDVLEAQRNQVMHARPLTMIGPNGEVGDALLGVLPRAGRGGRPDRNYEERPLTAEHLREAADAVAAVHARWAKAAGLAFSLRLPIG
jgi:hypothetical protein